MSKGVEWSFDRKYLAEIFSCYLIIFCYIIWDFSPHYTSCLIKLYLLFDHYLYYMIMFDSPYLPMKNNAGGNFLLYWNFT